MIHVMKGFHDIPHIFGSGFLFVGEPLTPCQREDIPPPHHAGGLVACGFMG
jgi:hypothetical protein